jgi:PEGA domain
MKIGFLTAAMFAAALAVGASPAAAQHRGGAVVGRAAPRVVGSPRIISPRVVGVVPFRPYYYPYRPGLTVGFFPGVGGYYGYPYGYVGYGYPWGYPYGYYGYPGYYPPPGYVSVVPGRSYGGVRITGAPREAQVFADGYYVGVVDNFDGTFQHLNLEAGPHRIEIRHEGAEPVAFDVNVRPGETITYHAAIR